MLYCHNIINNIVHTHNRFLDTPLRHWYGHTDVFTYTHSLIDYAIDYDISHITVITQYCIGFLIVKPVSHNTDTMNTKVVFSVHTHDYRFPR